MDHRVIAGDVLETETSFYKHKDGLDYRISEHMAGREDVNSLEICVSYTRVYRCAWTLQTFVGKGIRSLCWGQVFGTPVKVLLGTPGYHFRVPWLESLLLYLVPASCQGCTMAGSKVMAHVPESLLPRQETLIEFQVPGLSLFQPWLFWTFGEQTRRCRISL